LFQTTNTLSAYSEERNHPNLAVRATTRTLHWTS